MKLTQHGRDMLLAVIGIIVVVAVFALIPLGVQADRELIAEEADPWGVME